MLLSVVIPCYNSGEWIAELADSLEDSLSGINYEIILVNDASPDDGRTRGEIQRIAESSDNIIGIDLQFNTGQFASTMCGFFHSRGSMIVTMDDDFQHLPEEVPKLVTELQKRSDLDCIIASYQRKKDSFIRNQGSILVRKIYEWGAGKPKDLQMGSFRVMRRSVAEAMLQHRTRRPVLGPLLISSTSSIGNLEVKHAERKRGKSGYKIRKLIRTTMDNLFDSTTAPLRSFSSLGFLITLFSAILGSYYLYGYLTGSITVPGFTTIILMISFFGGMTILGLGLIGQYIDRIVREVRGAPRWHVKRIFGTSEEMGDGDE